MNFIRTVSVHIEEVPENSHSVRFFFDGKSYKNKDEFETVGIISIHESKETAYIHTMLGRFNIRVFRLLQDLGRSLDLKYIYFARTEGRMKRSLAQYMSTQNGLDFFRIKIDG